MMGEKKKEFLWENGGKDSGKIFIFEIRKNEAKKVN